MRPSRPNSTPARRWMLVVSAALAALLVLAPAATADLLTPESGGSPQADDIDTLYKYVLAVAFLVFLGVEGVLLYSVFKFKARKGAVAAQIRGNTRLEVGWTVGAALILVILAVLTFVKLDEIRNPPNSKASGLQLADGALVADATRRLPPNGKSLNVCVEGLQYIWRYKYARDCRNAPLDAPFTYEEMVVPTNTTVTLDIQAYDVAHSWWIPELGGKMDAVPGYTNHTWFQIPKPGLYRGQCAELCGRGHANMTARVRALPPAQFEAYLARLETDIDQADEAAARQREEFQETGEVGEAAEQQRERQQPIDPQRQEQERQQQDEQQLQDEEQQP